MDTLRQNGTTRGPWQQTHSGGMFHPSDPTVDEVRIDDIAVALAKQVRYNGHTLGFDIYSVAQHAVHVSEVVEDLGGSVLEQYWGLHHDDAEAYTGDIVTQIKAAVPELRAYLKRVEPVVAEAMGLGFQEEPRIVKHADMVMLATEKRDIMAPKAMWVPETWGPLPEPRSSIIEVMAPFTAYSEYMARHYDLLDKLDWSYADIPAMNMKEKVA